MAEKHTIPGIEKSKYREHTYIGPTSEREEATHAWVEEHDEENFWSTLCTRLARRDFFNTMTDDDRAEMEKTGWLPESAQKHFARYEQEFETYGVERVVIDENASIPSGLLLQ